MTRQVRCFGLLTLVAPCLAAAPVFQDGFESTAFGPPWLADTTQTGRVTIETQYGPATGARHLVLDDQVNDAIYSVAEAILPLNLTQKRNVVLSFKVKSLGNDPDPPPAGVVPSGTRNFDAVTVSLDGGATWRTVRSLATVGEAWETVSVALDPLVGGAAAFGSDVRLRFSAYDNSPAPLDGIAIDDVLVEAADDQRASFELPAGPLAEGGPSYTGVVVLSFPPQSPLTLTLTATGVGQLNLPASVTVPAGETAASFTFSVVDDALVNLTRTATLNATAPGVSSTPAVLSITDDEKPVVRLELPAQVVEGVNATVNAAVSMDLVPAVAVRFDLTAVPSGQISLPASVTIQPGQSQARFTARAIDDTRVDGDVPVTVTATAASLAPVTAVVTAVDNESRALSLQGPDSLVEGASATASVRVAGTMSEDLTVKLAGVGQSGLSLPSSVVIRAGQTEASFTLRAVDNTLKDGNRTVEWTATAETFTGATRPVLIQDNDPAGYAFEPLAELINMDGDIRVKIKAYDVEGEVMTTAAGALTFVLELPDGTTRPGTAVTAFPWFAGTWEGWVGVPKVMATPLRLRVSDAGGTVGRSAPFDGVYSVFVRAADLVWDGRRGRFYASVLPSSTEHANHIVAVNPETLEVTGRLDPGSPAQSLALGSGGDVLYAALQAEGAVARIDPETMTLLGKFPVGRNSSDEVLFAEDLAAVPGHPQRVVVSRARPHEQLRHQGVAVYENGVPLPSTTPVDSAGSNVLIEASAEDPATVFGRCIEFTDKPIRKLRLTAGGVEEVWARPTLEVGAGTDYRPAGGRIFMGSGHVHDGELTQRLGRLEGIERGGLVLPELDRNRVLFFEHSSSFDEYFVRLGVYDAAGYRMIRRVTLDPTVVAAESLTRWGANGLAWRAQNALMFTSSRQLVPDGTPADVAVSIDATPNPATVADEVTYTVHVTNHGPGIARDVRVQASLAQADAFLQATAEEGAVLYGFTPVEARFDDLEAGATVTLVIRTGPRSPFLRGCLARATTASIEPVPANNEARQAVGLRVEQTPDSVVKVYSPKDSMVYDSQRKLLWLTQVPWLPRSGEEWILSLDPQTGRLGEPLVLADLSNRRTLALSEDGRSLYVALSRVPEVQRFDLEGMPPASVRLPLRDSGGQRSFFAADLALPSGVGNGFLMTSPNEPLVGVYDAAVPRPGWISQQTIDRLEGTRVPGVAVGLSTVNGNRELTRLDVTPAGVMVGKSVPNVGEPGGDIVAEGGWVLTSTGRLFDAVTLDEIRSFPFQGRPCLDAARRQALFVYGREVRAYDATTGSMIGSMPLPVLSTGDWADACVRWGLDGLAILGDNFVHLVRWSQIIPENADENANGIADRWEAANLGPFGGDLADDPDGDGLPSVMEYIFGTAAGKSTADPREVSVTGAGLVRLVFPRRAGLAPGWYAYQAAARLDAWTTVTPVSESVMTTQTVDGVAMETVEALIELPAGGSGYVRLVAPPR